jgi:hypothetical protein
MNTLSSVSQRRIISKQAIPSALHATASPSMMQDRGRSPATASTMSGKRPAQVGSVPRKPSCLISCSHRSPEGGRGAMVGRHQSRMISTAELEEPGRG